MSSPSPDAYRYEVLPASFRVLELFPEKRTELIRCSLHIVDWTNPTPGYEAVSYAWGDASLKVPVACNGKRLDIPVSAHAVLDHLRYKDRSRFLWVDAVWNRSVQCGNEELDWYRLQLVAGYFTAETALSESHGFSKAYCWYATRISAGGFTYAENWLQMLYLTSNCSCTDPRDQIFGLCGLIKAKDGADLLHPDYSKSTLQVYRDSVEAAFLDFRTTDVLNYISGTPMDVSWVPGWNRSMLFRNPFRMGKIPPWRPAGDTEATWKIDRDANILYLSGSVLDMIESVEPYNEDYFCDSRIQSEESRRSLNANWRRVLQTIGRRHPPLPLSHTVLNAVATSLSFGLDKNADLADEDNLLLNFIAYLQTVIVQETFGKYVSLEISKGAQHGDGRAFGKPVWDFTYPGSTLFTTANGLMGCSIASNEVGDTVFVSLGSRHPLVLRPNDGQYSLRGFTFVYGRMIGTAPAHIEVIKIR